jgi:hypothetical protein
VRLFGFRFLSFFFFVKDSDRKSLDSTSVFLHFKKKFIIFILAFYEKI